ncbi:MAG TPA: TAXI family TRAP transporter solute-binding subunit [Jiangellaceae bacterium]
MRARLGLVAAAVVLAGCTGGAAIEGPVMVSGGGTGGIYYGYGGELASVLGGEFDVETDVLETGGSLDNLRNLADRRVHLAFSAADVAGDAAAGRAPFGEPLPVVAAARVYDDFVHLVVPGDSSIMTIEDLRDRDVSLGAPGSGTEVIAGRLLDAARIDPAEVANAKLGIDESIEALRGGRIEAFFWSGGLPTPGIDELAESVEIRLVDLSELVDELRAEYGGGYRPGVVPMGTYDLPRDVTTLAVPNFLMVRADAPDEFVYETLSLLFDQQSRIAANVPAAAILDKHRAIYTDPVDLHPGALEYYRDTKP